MSSILFLNIHCRLKVNMVTTFKQQDAMQINFNFTDSIVLNYDILYFVLNNKCYNECFPDKKLYIINYHKSYEFTNPLTYIIKKNDQIKLHIYTLFYRK